MTFEQAAALKILFDTEEVQVITDDDEVHPAEEGEPAGVVVKQHGIIDVDTIYWDAGEAIKHLAEQWD